MVEEGELQKRLQILFFEEFGFPIITEEILQHLLNLVDDIRREFPKDLWISKKGYPDITPLQKWFVKWFGKMPSAEP